MIMKELAENGVGPKEIVTTLQRHEPTNYSTMSTIYNEYKLKTIEMQARNAVQKLLHLLSKKHYVYLQRRCEKTDIIEDIFFFHPTSILLAKCFPTVFVIDGIYETN